MRCVFFRSLGLVLTATIILSLCSGCAWIADKDRIIIASVGEQPIRRGDLAKVIREMPDEERPSIRNKGDVLDALNNYIDRELKTALVQKLVAEGKLVVIEGQDQATIGAKSRELMKEGKIGIPHAMAEEAYFQKNPDHRVIRMVKDPSALEMSEAEFTVMRNQVEDGISRVLDLMLAEAAVAMKGGEALKSGAIVISDEEFGREYEIRKDELKNFENIEFLAVRFPASLPDAESRASEVRRRHDAGEQFDAIIAEFLETNPSFVLRSAIENNPASVKFRGFWSSTSGCKNGDVIGPVFLPSYEMMGQGPDGKPAVQTMPDAYLVFEVLEHTPETQKPLEQAKRDLAPAILQQKTIALLRQENGVAVFEDKLPDPSLFGEDRTRSVMEK